MTLEELLAKVMQEPVTVEYPSAEVLAIKGALTDLSVSKQMIETLRKGLAFYAPGSFWDEVPPSRAAEDRGKHAEWLLRLTDPSPV